MPSPHYIPLGSAPCDEDCADIGSPTYALDAQKECLAYIKAIRRKVGVEPPGAQLAVMAFRHSDFGIYYEVVAHFDAARPASVAYAQRCEREAPASWGEVGLRPPLNRRREVGGR